MEEDKLFKLIDAAQILVDMIRKKESNDIGCPHLENIGQVVNKYERTGECKAGGYARDNLDKFCLGEYHSCLHYRAARWLDDHSVSKEL